MVASRVDEEISILRSWRRMPGGYDAISKRVNVTYAETGDIRETMVRAGLTFDEVWDMTGMKDWFEWKD